LPFNYQRKLLSPFTLTDFLLRTDRVFINLNYFGSDEQQTQRISAGHKSLEFQGKNLFELGHFDDFVALMSDLKP